MLCDVWLQFYGFSVFYGFRGRVRTCCVMPERECKKRKGSNPHTSLRILCSEQLLVFCARAGATDCSQVNRALYGTARKKKSIFYFTLARYFTPRRAYRVLYPPECREPAES